MLLTLNPFYTNTFFAPKGNEPFRKVLPGKNRALSTRLPAKIYATHLSLGHSRSSLPAEVYGTTTIETIY